MAQLDGDQFHCRSGRCTRVEEFGVAITSNDLRRRHRREAQPVSDESLDRRVDVRIGTDRSAELADTDGRSRRAQTLPIAIDLQCPEGHFHPECGRLGVYSVGAADHHRVAVGDRQLLDDDEQLVGRIDQQVARISQHPTPRRVDHIATRQSVVDPRTGRRTDRTLDDVHERGDIVVGDGFSVEHGLHERLVHLRCAFATASTVGLGHQPEGDVGLGGQQLDLQPASEPLDVGENIRHLRE